MFRLLRNDSIDANSGPSIWLARFSFIRFGLLLTATFVSLPSKCETRAVFQKFEIEVLELFRNIYKVITNDFVLTQNNATTAPLNKLLESARKLLLALSQAKLRFQK